MTQSFHVLIEADTDEADAVLAALELRLSSAGLGMFLESVVDPWIRQRISARFASEGDDMSGKWHPLAVATQQIRAYYGHPPDHPINVRSGDLRSFLISEDSDIKMWGGGASLIHPPQGSASPMMAKKIATAQGGSSFPPTPARPVIGVDENDLVFITSSLAAWLTQDLI
jgi:hypothetical protein